MNQRTVVALNFGINHHIPMAGAEMKLYSHYVQEFPTSYSSIQWIQQQQQQQWCCRLLIPVSAQLLTPPRHLFIHSTYSVASWPNLPQSPMCTLIKYSALLHIFDRYTQELEDVHKLSLYLNWTLHVPGTVLCKSHFIHPWIHFICSALINKYIRTNICVYQAPPLVFHSRGHNKKKQPTDDPENVSANTTEKSRTGS